MFLGLRTLTATTTTSSTYKTTQREKKSGTNTNGWATVGPNDERCRLGRLYVFILIWFFFLLTNVFIGSIHHLLTKQHKGTNMSRTDERVGPNDERVSFGPFCIFIYLIRLK